MSSRKNPILCIKFAAVLKVGVPAKKLILTATVMITAAYFLVHSLASRDAANRIEKAIRENCATCEIKIGGARFSSLGLNELDFHRIRFKGGDPDATGVE